MTSSTNGRRTPPLPPPHHLNIANSEDDQSSLDLSLTCLRRNSNDSRDSFYMDFDRGIDSDIDVDGIVATASTATAGNPLSSNAVDDDCTTVSLQDDDDPSSSSRLSRRRAYSRSTTKDHWVGLNRPNNNRHGQVGVDVEEDDVDDDEDEEDHDNHRHAPSPVCPARILASPELLGSVISSSQGTSSGKATGLQLQLQLPNGTANRANEVKSLIGPADRDPVCPRYDDATASLLLPAKDSRLLYTQKPSRSMVEGEFDDDVFAKTQEKDSVAMVLSAMYAKLLVVMGIGFPLAEVISPYIPPSFFVGFYLYLYSGSILFLIYAYSFLLHKTPASHHGGVQCGRRTSKHHQQLPSRSTSGPGPGIGLQSVLLNKISFVAKLNGGKSGTAPHHAVSKESGLHRIRVEEAAVHCGSFYLRMGAVAFGIGSMIYSGLEFGQFFELDPTSSCYSVLMAVTPCAQMAFTFIQLYFIFMNSKMCIHKFKNVARFGLMHMVATNLCVWLHVLVQESKHEILKFLDPSHGGTGGGQHSAGGGGHGLPPLNFSLGFGRHEIASPKVHHRVTRGLSNDPSFGFQCRRVNIMGQLVQDVSPFLFPCTIEYSLICAAIVYMMWKNIGKRAGSAGNDHGNRLGSSASSEFATLPSRRHHYSVDCAHANKGLFTGILVLVLAIISLILFFVLINRPEYKDLAVLEAHISELVLYCLNIIAAVIALMQVRELRYSVHHYVELDNLLLVISQTGVYLFAIFCVIGGHFTITHSTVLVLLTAVANLVQATVQTIFVLDASRRHASTTDQVRRKPGREMITFMLVCNLTMWAINSLEIRRSDANPTQLNFYGFWAWTIIAHVSSPLAIFFRFHSTVCLCEIWKKLYKLKAERV